MLHLGVFQFGKWVPELGPFGTRPRSRHENNLDTVLVWKHQVDVKATKAIRTSQNRNEKYSMDMIHF